MDTLNNISQQSYDGIDKEHNYFDQMLEWLLETQCFRCKCIIDKTTFNQRVAFSMSFGEIRKINKDKSHIASLQPCPIHQARWKDHINSTKN